MKPATGLARVLVGCALVACQGKPAPGAELAVVGESTRPRWEDPLPAVTPLFDGERVRLRGVRGETLGVHVVRAPRKHVPVALAFDGDGSAGLRLEAFTVEHHRVNAPSTSMYGGSRGRGRYPDRLTPTQQPVTAERSAFFDLAIARDAAPGPRTGTLTVGERRIPVELVIEDLELPDLAAAPWVWAYYDAKEVKRADDVADVLGQERRYAALFRSRGVVASPELTAASWTDRKELVAGLRFIPVLLPLEPAAIATEVAGWIERTAGSGQVPFAIPIDEPRRLIDQLRVRARAGWVRAGGGGPGRFLYAVTHEPSWLLGGDVDIYISPSAAGKHAGAWTYNGGPPWAGAMVLDAAEPGTRTWGWIGFRYDVPLWYVWDAMYWRDRYNRGRDAAPLEDLREKPVTFDDGEDHGNLDGVLVYPGVLPSLRLDAIRRGLQDRALLELLAACAGRPAADAIVTPLVPRALGEARRGERASWPSDDAVFERARLRVLDELVACRRRPPAPSSPPP